MLVFLVQNFIVILVAKKGATKTPTNFLLKHCPPLPLLPHPPIPPAHRSRVGECCGFIVLKSINHVLWQLSGNCRSYVVAGMAAIGGHKAKIKTKRPGKAANAASLINKWEKNNQI